MRYFAIACCAVLVGLSVVGCDDIDNKLDCESVCNRYKECVNDDYDVDSCKSSCESEANASEDKERQLETCDTCIQDRSCGGAVFNCSTECAGIIAG